MSAFAVRELESRGDLDAVRRLQKDIWSFRGGGIPEPILAEAFGPQGIAVGACATSGEVVGFAFSCCKADDPTVQFSYMVGVLPAWRLRGVGYRLKIHQRLIAARKGVRAIESTFDPLQSVNARFHIHKLGVRVLRYAEDYFRGSSSPLHIGTPTDRFVAEWPVLSGDTLPAPEPASGPNDHKADLAYAQVRIPREVDGCPVVELPLPTERAVVTVGIPHDFTTMQSADVSRALAWRLTTRQIFSWYLARGYGIADFIYGPSQGIYVMQSGRDDV